MAKKIPIKAEKITPENKCSFCTSSKCCTYFTHQIDKPRKKKDFEHMLWQISHKGVQYYKDEDGWFLLVNSPCIHLQDGGGCGIYDDRPKICRQYDNDYCEYDASAEEGFELFFDSYKSLLKHCKKKFKNWDKKKKKKKKKKDK